MKAKLILTLSDGTKIQSSEILLDSMCVTTEIIPNVAGVTVSFLFRDADAVQALLNDLRR